VKKLSNAYCPIKQYGRLYSGHPSANTVVNFGATADSIPLWVIVLAVDRRPLLLVLCQLDRQLLRTFHLVVLF